MHRVVFDTNVFLRALINPNGVNARLMAASDRYELILSEEIIKEILDVLFRSSLRERYSQLKEIEMPEVFSLISRLLTLPCFYLFGTGEGSSH